jgi:hypothetical protein
MILPRSAHDFQQEKRSCRAGRLAALEIMQLFDLNTFETSGQTGTGAISRIGGKAIIYLAVLIRTSLEQRHGRRLFHVHLGP